ncbi:Etoposide induced 2.4 mRNA [Irineochytrium annulatum]|nr:Etoposide induced 2.4 mRNA [Irineochytrium annulatum]
MSSHKKPRSAPTRPIAPSSSSGPVRTASLAESAVLTLDSAWNGLRDAFAWPAALIVIYGSKTIQTATLKCFLLNGLIFLGSILLFDHLLSPLAAHLASAALSTGASFSASPSAGVDGDPASSFPETPPNGTDDIGGAAAFLSSVGSALTALYHLLWVYPVYLVSFVLNSYWYQAIADRSFAILRGERVTHPRTYDRLLKRIADESYRALLLFNYLATAAAMYSVPVVGPFLSFALFNWIGAFFSFEYKWASKGWTLERKLEYFEDRWAYFAGFGG